MIAGVLFSLGLFYFHDTPTMASLGLPHHESVIMIVFCSNYLTEGAHSL